MAAVSISRNKKVAEPVRVPHDGQDKRLRFTDFGKSWTVRGDCRWC
jgi:hypothetical protein